MHVPIAKSEILGNNIEKLDYLWQQSLSGFSDFLRLKCHSPLFLSLLVSGFILPAFSGSTT